MGPTTNLLPSAEQVGRGSAKAAAPSTGGKREEILQVRLRAISKWMFAKTMQPAPQQTPVFFSLYAGTWNDHSSAGQHVYKSL